MFSMSTCLRTLAMLAWLATGVLPGRSMRDFGDSVMTGWARDPSCAAEHLANTSSMPQAAKCGAAVVLVQASAMDVQTTVYTAGAGGFGGSAPFDEHAMIEVASISKLFTALLLQSLVDEGHVSYQTQLVDSLGCEASGASYATPLVRSITLLELATHTSGLPAHADNRHLDGDNPFANYTHTDLCGTLMRIRGLPMRGKFIYSDLGFGLLGYLLELTMGRSFEELTMVRVLSPLGMIDTRVVIPEHEWSGGAVAPGLDPKTGVGPVWRRSPYGVLQGNGAFHSTLADMARFTQAAFQALRGAQGPLSGTLRRTFQTQVSWDCPCLRDFCEAITCDGGPNAWHGAEALAWQSFTHGLYPGWRKAGDSEGYSSNLVIIPAKGRAVFGFDTCGGCGSGGQAGSAIQRTVQILAGGPARSAPKLPDVRAAELEWLTGTFAAPELLRSSVEVFLDEQGLLLVQTSDGEHRSEVVHAKPLMWDEVVSREVHLLVSLGDSVGSDGGGPRDRSQLSEVQQMRELIFLRNTSDLAARPRMVVLTDGGQDTYYVLTNRSAEVVL